VKDDFFSWDRMQKRFHGIESCDINVKKEYLRFANPEGHGTSSGFFVVMALSGRKESLKYLTLSKTEGSRSTLISTLAIPLALVFRLQLHTLDVEKLLQRLS
jgi:hypothetical protein